MVLVQSSNAVTVSCNIVLVLNVESIGRQEVASFFVKEFRTLQLININF